MKRQVKWVITPRLLLVSGLVVAALAALLLISTGGGDEEVFSKSRPVLSQEDIFLQKSERAGIPTPYARAYFRFAQEQGLDPAFLAALGHAESNHGSSPLPGVKSGINSAGCCSGPMQICSVSACGNVAGEYGTDGNGDRRVNIFSPADSIATAASYLHWMQDYLGGNPRLLAAGYNAGPTIVNQIGGVPAYPETRAYVKKVLRYRQFLLQRKI